MIKQLLEKLFWRTALVVALVATPYAYYLKFPSVRKSVNAKVPQFKTFMKSSRKRGQESVSYC